MPILNGQEQMMGMNPQQAAGLLDEAIELHMAHMDGTEPTSPESQGKLLDLMRGAREALGGGRGEMMDDESGESGEGHEQMGMGGASTRMDVKRKGQQNALRRMV